nr:MAG TPA: hypothetical protein [Caudoviricetes sp.]
MDMHLLNDFPQYYTIELNKEMFLFLYFVI